MSRKNPRGTSARAKAMTEATQGAPDIPGVLLAGGLARRMGGGDKPMRTIAGRTILDRVIARLMPQCDGLILNANGDPARFAAFGLPVIADSVADFPGPLAGILAALDWAAANRPDMEFVLSAAGRLPIPAARPDVAAPWRDRSGNAELAVAASDGQSHPVIGLWSVRFTRTAPSRARSRGRQENRPLDCAISGSPRCPGRPRRSTRFSMPIPWMTLRRRSDWPSWTGVRRLPFRIEPGCGWQATTGYPKTGICPPQPRNAEVSELLSGFLSGPSLGRDRALPWISRCPFRMRGRRGFPAGVTSSSALAAVPGGAGESS